jgi:hypothetical protein
MCIPLSVRTAFSSFPANVKTLRGRSRQAGNLFVADIPEDPWPLYRALLPEHNALQNDNPLTSWRIDTGVFP